MQETVPTVKKRQKTVVSAQLKKDIENSLEPDAKDAIINGYLSLLNKDYILRDELDLDLVSIGNGHQLETVWQQKNMTEMVNDAKKDGCEYQRYIFLPYLCKTGGFI